jgi:HEAT repeat protein
MKRFAAATAALLGVVTARFAPAETHVTCPPGGGLPKLDVTVDLAAGVLDANGTRVPIPLEHARVPAERDVVIELIAIGQDKHVVHVKVPVKDDPGGTAWEAILAAGRTQPIFAGITGLASGDSGERTGKAVQIVPNGATSFVIVGDVHEDLGICGHNATLFEPRALYPTTLDLRPATVQRLTAEEQETAQKIVAKPKGSDALAPLAKLLVARGSSVPGSRGAELTDGDPRTVWSEERPGVGQGEFVVMAAPKDVPIARIRVSIAPPGANAASGAAPRTFYLVTTTQNFEVTMPEDAWLKPGEAYEVAFEKPIATSCVALVLGSAFSRGQAHPVVSFAEIAAFSEFDKPGATLDDVANALSTDRGNAAAQVLERAGDPALVAVEKAYEGLDVRGRARAMDVAAAHERCDEAAPLMARGLCEKAGEAPRKAHEKLERCKGAAPVLAKRLREDAATRTCVAPTLAAIAPDEALEPIADAMAATPDAETETRAALRSALASALVVAPPEKLAKLVGDAGRPAATRLEIMRAAKARVTEAPGETMAAVTELLRGSPSMRIRYLVLGPLEQMARAGDRAAASHLIESIARDPDWPVRARAADAGAGVADTQAALVAAVGDREPRVREAALQSLVASPSASASQVAKTRLNEDGWSFVKTQAVAVLAKGPASGDVDEALGNALHDRSVAVRGGALIALGRHQASAWRDAIRERLDDEGEDSEVRAAAARALGSICDARSADRLTELARRLGAAGPAGAHGAPATAEDEQQVALGALEGLAALQPRDLRNRLAALTSPSAPPHVRAAAEQALAARGVCRQATSPPLR